MNDIERIKHIEQKLGFKLNQVSLENLFTEKSFLATSNFWRSSPPMNREPETCARCGAPLTGNQLRFAWHEPGPDNGSFNNFQLQSSGVAAFTITNGIFAPPPAQVLTIARAGHAVLVSWPYEDNYSYLESGYEVNGVASFSYVPGVQLVGSHWQASVPLTTTNQLFFRLYNWCVSYNASLNNP